MVLHDTSVNTHTHTHTQISNERTTPARTHAQVVNGLPITAESAARVRQQRQPARWTERRAILTRSIFPAARPQSDRTTHHTSRPPTDQFDRLACLPRRVNGSALRRPSVRRSVGRSSGFIASRQRDHLVWSRRRRRRKLADVRTSTAPRLARYTYLCGRHMQSTAVRLLTKGH